jgi:hypothetical protein
MDDVKELIAGRAIMTSSARAPYRVAAFQTFLNGRI